MNKRILSIVLALVMLVSLIPLGVSADETEIVYITASDDASFLILPNGEPFANLGIEIANLASIDLNDYALGDFIYDADSDGTPEITALHLFIYIHTVILDLDWSEVWVSGSPGSIYFAGGLFGYSDENLRYDLNGSYPNVDGWGTTADQIVLSGGDFFNVAHYSSWAFWGDSATGFHYFADAEDNIIRESKAQVGEPCAFKVIRSFSDWNNGGAAAFENEPYFTVYYGTTYSDAVGSVTTDDNGYVTIDFPYADTWYIWTDGGYGAENFQDIVSAPALATVNVESETKLEFLGAAGISFQDYIGMNVMILNSSVAKYDKVYVKAVQIDPEKGAVETICGTVPYAYGGVNYTIFEHQVMAWSMTEEVTLTLYAELDGVTYVGQTVKASVQTLALEKLKTYAGANNKVACAALVDMLNYGAALQVNQKHNVESLPTAGDYASYGTTTTPELNATNTTTGTGSFAHVAVSVSMQAKVEFNVMYANANVKDRTVKAFVNGEEVGVEYDTTSAVGYTIARVAIAANKLRTDYTIAVYDADGNVVSKTLNASIEACAKSKLNASNEELVIALMRYGDAVSKIG